jgi:hypothetical protein
MAFTLEDEANAGESTANPKTLLIYTGVNTTVSVVFVITTGGASVIRQGGAPTIGGNTMTQAGTRQYSGGEGHVECFYYIGSLPDSVGTTISVPNSPKPRILSLIGSTYISPALATATYIDTDQNSGTSTNPTTPAVTVEAPGLVVNGLFTGADNVSLLTAGQTLLGKYDTGAEGHAHQYFLVTSDGTKVMNWSFATSDDWAINSVSFREDSGTISAELINGVKWTDVTSINGVALALISEINGLT